MRNLLFIFILITIAYTFYNCKKEDEFHGAKVHNGSVTFISQDEVDNFGSQGYEIIEGDFIIGSLDLENDNIEDLSKLFTVDRIHGNLIIGGNISLSDLSGLNGISEVTGGLIVRNNPAITNLDPFIKLDTLTHLFIENNKLLENINGLKGLRLLYNFASLRSNPSLTNVIGFQNLEKIGTSLEIYQNQRLEYLQGLENIKELEDLFISQNHLLRNLDALVNLENVTSRLVVYNNTYLNNIDGLSKLQYTNDLIIYYNTSLTDVDGLASLTKAGNLQISLNNNLNNLEGLLNLQQVSQQVEINTNPNLFNVCGIKPLLTNGFSEFDFSISENGYNPSYQEIINGNCSK